MHATLLIILENEDDQDMSIEDLMEPYYQGGLNDLQPQYLEFEPEIYSDEFERIFTNHIESLDRINERSEIQRLYEKTKKGLGYAVADIQGWEYSKKHDAVGYWYNPYGYWDWYVIGGRWEGFFKIKPESTSNYKYDEVDICYKKDIDFERMKKEYIELQVESIKTRNQWAIKRNQNFPDTESIPLEEVNIDEIEKNAVPFMVRSILYKYEWIDLDGGEEEEAKYLWDIINNLPDNTKFILVDYHS